MGTMDDCGATPGEPCRLLPAGLCACCEDEAESETGRMVEVPGRAPVPAAFAEKFRVPVPVGYTQCADCGRWPEFCRC